LEANVATLAEIRTGLSSDGSEKPTHPVCDVDLLARLRSYIAAGESDHNICVELDVRPSELKSYKARLFEQESEALSASSTSDTYVKYRLRMERICDDLDGVHQGAVESRQFTAAMGALKAKAGIIDKVIDRGQDMGLVSRIAKRHELVGGVAVAHLTDEQLLGKMKDLHETTQDYISKYGNKTIGEIDIPDIYSEGE
jgi:hypothetical protein